MKLEKALQMVKLADDRNLCIKLHDQYLYLSQCGVMMDVHGYHIVLTDEEIKSNEWEII